MKGVTVIHQRHSDKRDFPVRLFAVAFVISMLTTVFAGWLLWQEYNRIEEMSRKHIALTESVGRIILLDESLTMSARLAATGDFSYEERYDQFDPQLTKEINKLRALLPQQEIEQFVKETDEANLALVKMERQAFALTHQRRQREAMALLTSDEYTRLKKVYADGMQKTISAKNSLLAIDIQSLHSLSFISAAVSTAGVLVLLATWFFAARSTRNWAGERIEAENMLREARDGLEVRVKLRTADLLETNEKLSQEILDHRSTTTALQKSEENKRLLLHAVGEGIFEVNTTGQVIFINPAALRMLGFAEEEVVARNAHSLFHHSHEDGSNYPVEDCPMYASYNMAIESSMIEEVLWRKNGDSFFVEYSSMPIIRDNMVTGAVVVFKDITERKRVEEVLRDRQKELQTIMDAAPMAITWSDMEGNIQYINHAFHKLFGYTLEDIPTTVDFRRLAYPSIKADLEAHTAHVLEQKERLKQGEEVIAIEVVLTCKDGSMRHVEVLGTVASNKRMVIYTDITERKQSEEKIRQMAYHDSLTGFPNRKLFSDRLSIALAQSKRNHKMVGVAMLDLDNFKDVNDTLGHDVGDLLLIATAERLSAALRKGDTVARFGGDEFVLILPDLKVIEDAVQVAQKIVDSFRKPFLIGTHQLAVTISIGIVIYPHDGADEGVLLKNADIAMYHAKQAGRARYQLYNVALISATNRISPLPV